MKRLLAFWLFGALSIAFAQVPITTVEGDVYIPGGAKATSGIVQAELSNPGVVEVNGVGQMVVGRVAVQVQSDGSISLPLIPNDEILPAGTFYRVAIQVEKPLDVRYWEMWVVASTPDPVSIGAVSRVRVPTGVTVGPYTEYVATQAEATGACAMIERPKIALDTRAICDCVANFWSCDALGGGDMARAVYDINLNGVVDQVPNHSATKITTGTLSITRGGTGVSAWANGRYIRTPLFGEDNEMQQALIVETTPAEIKLSGRLYLWDQSSEGTCDATYRYSTYVIRGVAGVADRAVVCLKSASDTYSWIDMAAGGP